MAETEKNNKLLLVGDKGFHPSETIVAIDFAEEPKTEYADLKISRNGNYPYLTFSDNKGALEVDFGRIKEDRFKKE